MLKKLLFRYKSLKMSIVSINWDISWQVEKVFLEKLLLERKTLPNKGVYDSIYQYKAQTFKKSLLDILILQIVSFCAFFLLTIRYLFSPIKKSINLYDVAFFYKKDIFDSSVIGNKELVFIDANQGSLTFGDFCFICKVLYKTRFNFIIMSTVVYRMAQSSFAIRTYSIKELWVNMEYSCASGILKDYCFNKNIVLNNFMHGEKILTLRDAFSCFDRFYVWNNDYFDMFQTLNTNSEIIISNPWLSKSIEIKANRNPVKRTICYFFKGVESDEEVLRLQESFDRLRVEFSFKIYVKDHPRQGIVSSRFTNVSVIDKDVNFEYLYSTIDYLCAQYSTVLTQCEMLGVNYLVDDISNIELANKLKERGYLMAQNVNLLSKFLK
ncbi:hypothetical protein [Myroides odoratimimus]|uniref:hypothetical protein n=1 Tax=Myroides odoratimimus TaxID=76832 RepID=UPI00257737F9|nr:hypothetical protein [Myroides odoratimimus]MDM1086233.1 hypothetical protein [Myroides odoratimimus]